jgi:hypothetical protein
MDDEVDERLLIRAGDDRPGGDLSPETRTTPVARPSREVIAVTSALVRISAPAPCRRGQRR